MFNDCFPLIKVKISSKDPPFMTPLVKHLCKIRNRQIKRGINPELQERINKVIRENQISAVREENRKFELHKGLARPVSVIMIIRANGGRNIWENKWYGLPFLSSTHG